MRAGFATPLVCLALLCSSSCAPARPTPLTDSLLAAASEWGYQEFDATWVREQLTLIARDAARAARSQPRHEALRQTIFERWHFVREVEDPDLRFALLPDVVLSRRGGCVGLSSVYLAVAELLDWSMNGVIVPGHFFVRMTQHGAERNVELLRRGQSLPDAWYRERFPIPSAAAHAYGRALALEEVLGIVEYNAGEDRRRRGQLLEAQRAFDRATGHFPAFAEARASRGTMAHLLGRLDEALLDYQIAQRTNPSLPGVAQNITLLERELERRRPSR